jgi:hypothetical protein
MKINKQKLTMASAVAISLASLAVLQADENPFRLQSISKPSNPEQKIAHG